jgi:hypothetical protein
VPYGTVLWIPACAGMTVLVLDHHESLTGRKS